MIKSFFISQSFKKLVIIFCMFCIAVSCRRQSNLSNSISNTKEGFRYEYYDYRSNDISQFLISAAEIKMEEIQMRQLAQQRGSNDFIKKLCIEMNMQHTMILKELNQLAEQREIFLPSQFSYYAQDTYQQLNNTLPEDFDKAYYDWIIRSQKESIALFNEASNDSTDLEINAWVKSVLPVLRKQLDFTIAYQKKFAKV